MIRSIHFENFKALARVDIALEPLTVIVGANASGKSSILDGLYYLARSATDLETSYLEGKNDAERLKTKNSPGRLALEARGDAIDRVRLEALPYEKKGPAANVTYMVEGLPFECKVPSKTTLSRKLAESAHATQLGRVARLRLDARQVAMPVEDTIVPRIESDGRGLGPVIAALAEARSPALERIEDDLGAVLRRKLRIVSTREAGTIEEREFIEVAGQRVPRIWNRDALLKSVAIEFLDQGSIPADLASEGTLLTLGLLTVLHGSAEPPDLVLLDDFDHGLHPRAQRDLIGCIRTIQALRPELQIICTTHSPYALDYFSPEEVRVMRLDADGHAHCRRLVDHPEWTDWSATMKAGEFWTFVGDGWIEGGAVASR